jgi:hypothetical protein
MRRSAPAATAVRTRAPARRHEVLNARQWACPQYDVPLLPPRIAVERADPAVERRVRAEEEAAERERQREEKAMRELHSGSRLAGSWREGNQKVSTPIGQTLRVRTPARFRR